MFWFKKKKIKPLCWSENNEVCLFWVVGGGGMVHLGGRREGVTWPSSTNRVVIGSSEAARVRRQSGREDKPGQPRGQSQETSVFREFEFWEEEQDDDPNGDDGALW